MPEGHTLHRLAGELQELVGERVRASSPQGRFTDGARVVDNRTVSAVDAYGKHLLVDLEACHLHVHLGLAGAMFRSDPDGDAKTGVRLRLRTPRVAWDLVAPSRCELLDAGARTALLARLGPDPLRGDDPSPVVAAITSSERTVGELLLDQAVVAGIGNVFRNEVLHLHGIDPARPGSSIAEEDVRAMWDTLTTLMARGVVEGRILPLETPPDVDRSTVDEADTRYVYKQERCRTCGSPVRTWELGRRTAYACPVCQR